MITAPPPPPKIASYKPAPHFATTLGARAALAQVDINHLKLMCCYFAMLGVSLFWLAVLTKYTQKPGCLPWCLTFIIISFVLATQLFSEQVRRTQELAQDAAKQEPRSLIKTLTVAYTLASFAICAAFVNTQWYVIDRTVLTQQIIEIELSPLVNAAIPDNHIPLAKRYMVQKPLNGKIVAATTRGAPSAASTHTPTRPEELAVRQPVASTVAGATARAVAPASTHSTAPVTARAVAPASTHIAALVAAHSTTPAKPVAAVQKSSTAPAKTVALPALTVPWSSVARSSARSLATTSGDSNAARHRSVPRASSGSSFFMEELPPAQLVEVKETDNSTPPTLHSTADSHGSSVNVSMLADYLRALHKIIKAAWSPPRETARSTEIIFRIKRSGELALVKVVRSSGDVDSDESAINAITTSAPFKPLPAAYSLASLDVDYTFNYTADKLTEVSY